MNDSFKMIAKTFFGLEEVLKAELCDLGAQKVECGKRMVSFYGDKGFMYKANLCLRTALKILIPIYSFDASSYEELYDKLYKYDWTKHMSISNTFLFNSVVSGNIFRHSLYVSQKAKDAVVDQFVSNNNNRPNVDLKHPDFRFHIHIRNNKCTLLIDSSGESLHKRGYRLEADIAPINEVLAAGIIYLTGWDKSTDFLDPMCGSGTFLIEACMISSQIPANLNKDEFGFENWKNWDENLFNLIRESKLKKVIKPEINFVGYDISASALQKATKNINEAGLQNIIKIKNQDFFESKNTSDDLFIIINPPYGKRLTGQINDLYKSIGDTLKNNYLDSNAWIISSNFEGIKNIGLKSHTKIKLLNGKLESRLINFPIYKGSKKVH